MHNMKNKEKDKNLFQKLISKAKLSDKRKEEISNTNATEKQKPKAPFKLLLCVGFSSQGKTIIEILKQKDIEMSMLVKGYGTAHSSMLSMLGIKETERDVVLGIVKTENSQNLISEILKSFESKNIKNTFCCLFSPTSASLETLNLIKSIKGVKND